MRVWHTDLVPHVVCRQIACDENHVDWPPSEGLDVRQHVLQCGVRNVALVVAKLAGLEARCARGVGWATAQGLAAVGCEA